MNPRILVVDDNADEAALLSQLLNQQNYESVTTTSPAQALDLLHQPIWDAVLSDLSMAEMSGTTLCEEIARIQPHLPIIVVTGHHCVEAAVSALRAGAFDFLTKPIDEKLLFVSVERAVRYWRLYVELSQLRETITQQASLETLIGDSPSMKRVTELIMRLSPSTASVLICGETGTGKELIARAIHHASSRSQGPFVAINCAAVPASLMESELFGYAKGAFTDAKNSKEGLFQRANGGTLFLDEIGDLPLEMQPKLLRALQERQVRPVGGNNEIPFDARIIAATNHDLETEVAERRFREDLYFRINVVRIDLPSLRERKSDIIALATHFVKKFGERYGRNNLRLSVSLSERLLAYNWPGNVRELENCIERLTTLARFDDLCEDDLPEKIRSYQTTSLFIPTDNPAELVTIDELEKNYIKKVLDLLNGHKTKAAKVLGLDRRTLYRKLELYEKEETLKNKRRDAPTKPLFANDVPL